MDYQRLHLSLAGPVARLVLAQPDAGNRVDERLLRELAEAVAAVAESTSAVVLLLTAEGADFCLGWNDGAAERVAAAQRAQPALHLDPFGCLAGLSIPVVAALQGGVVGAGLELVLCCDVRLAADDARFALSDIGEGRLPLAGGTQRLPRIVGRATALAMLLAGEALDAPAALRSGLASRVCAPEALSAEAGALAGLIASRGPLALRYAKEAVHAGLELPLAQGLRYENDLSVLLQATRDRAEGVDAFLTKQPPRFEGR